MASIGGFVKKNSSTILTIIGVVGVVSSIIFAVHDTPKALKLVDEEKKEKGEALTKFEIAKAAAPAYIPTAISGVTTIVCICGIGALSRKQQASILSAYAFLSNSYNKYRKKISELYGKEIDKKVYQESIKEVYCNKDISIEPYCGMEDEINEEDPVLFYDELSQRHFERPISAVIMAEYQLNREFSVRHYVSLNMFYEFLGLPPTDFGDTVGWGSAGYGWIDFYHEKIELETGLECYILKIDFVSEGEDYNEEIIEQQVY